MQQDFEYITRKNSAFLFLEKPKDLAFVILQSVRDERAPTLIEGSIYFNTFKASRLKAGISSGSRLVTNWF
ncbi:hypothetical protein J32TS6_35040 [Virgibacillus pantothenticus]|nr:hypothetical protein J32TS6_35040 [Virgibacillus pantothenticus]